MDLNSVVVRADDLLTQPIDAEMVILNLKCNNYVALDAVGRRIWDLLAAPCRVGDMCRQLGEEFAGAPEQINADVLRFLNELVSENLAHVVEG